MMVLEFFSNVLGTNNEFLDAGFSNPYRQIPEYRSPSAPTHYTTEGGGTYSARPDLSRSGGPGTYVLGGAIVIVGGSLYGGALITSAYDQVIKDETIDRQSSLWRSFSQSLTGGFGIGSGLNL